MTYTLHIYKIHSYNTSKYKAGIKLSDTKKSSYFKKRSTGRASNLCSHRDEGEEEEEEIQQTHTAFLGGWNSELLSFFCPRRLRRIASLDGVLRCGVAAVPSPGARTSPRRGFFTAGPELDSSNVRLKLAGGVLSASCALLWPLGDTLKPFWSVPELAELEGERLTDKPLL